MHTRTHARHTCTRTHAHTHTRTHAHSYAPDVVFIKCLAGCAMFEAHIAHDLGYLQVASAMEVAYAINDRVELR